MNYSDRFNQLDPSPAIQVFAGRRHDKKISRTFPKKTIGKSSENSSARMKVIVSNHATVRVPELISYNVDKVCRLFEEALNQSDSQRVVLYQLPTVTFYLIPPDIKPPQFKMKSGWIEFEQIQKIRIVAYTSSIYLPYAINNKNHNALFFASLQKNYEYNWLSTRPIEAVERHSSIKII